MPKKSKQEVAPEPVAAKKGAKSKDKPTAVAEPVKELKKAAKVEKQPATRTNAKHATIESSVILAAFKGKKDVVLTKKELVAACGGDEPSVTKAINKLRADSKIVAQGSTRSATYRLA